MIDPFPAGLTAPPTAVGQGGTFGAVRRRSRPCPATTPARPILDTAMTVGSNFVTQGGTVTVTLNVKSSVAVTERLAVGPRA